VRTLGHCGSIIRTSVRRIVTERQEKRVLLAKIKLARADLAGAAEILILRVGTFSKSCPRFRRASLTIVASSSHDRTQTWSYIRLGNYICSPSFIIYSRLNATLHLRLLIVRFII